MSMQEQRAAAHKMGLDAITYWRLADEFFASIDRMREAAGAGSVMVFTQGYDAKEGIVRLWYGLRTAAGERVSDGNGGFYDDATWPCPPFPPPGGGECI
jgi:hypothetical protein